YVQRRLIRQFIVQTMTAQSGADPTLVESLLTDERLLGGAGPLMEDLIATADSGLTVTAFASADASPPASAAVILPDAATGLVNAAGQALLPAGTNSSRIEGALQVPVDGAYRFLIELDKQDAEAELQFPHLTPPSFLKGAAPADKGTLGDGPGEFL